MAFVVRTAGDDDPGEFVTATATDAAGNTSEFSGALALGTVTPQEQIQRIIGDVQELVTQGVLNPGQANGLIAKLNNAPLQAFVLQVLGFITAGILTPAEGQSLIDAAQCVSTSPHRRRPIRD